MSELLTATKLLSAWFRIGVFIFYSSGYGRKWRKSFIERSHANRRCTCSRPVQCLGYSWEITYGKPYVSAGLFLRSFAVSRGAAEWNSGWSKDDRRNSRALTDKASRMLFPLTHTYSICTPLNYIISTCALSEQPRQWHSAWHLFQARLELVTL